MEKIEFLLVLVIVILIVESLDAIVVHKFKSVPVDSSAWDRGIQESKTMATLGMCASWGKQSEGHFAFTFDDSNRICQKAKGTCIRPADEANTKRMFMLSFSIENVGCYLDDLANPNLGTDLGVMAKDQMPHSCISACAEIGLDYAGITDGERCQCGDDRPADKQRLAEASCTSMCEGDDTMRCGGAIVFQSVYNSRNTSPSWQMTLDDKQNLWEVTATDPLSSDPQSQIAHLNDGDLGTFYWSEYVYRPWVQVDMKSSQLVKAVHLAGEANLFMDQIEVRVGSLEINSNPKPPNENKICINKLCYTSGLKADGTHNGYIQQDCIMPLSGRYVTIQRYKQAFESDTRLRLMEVDIVLFCDVDQDNIPDGMCPSEDGLDDMADCSLDEERGITYVGCLENALPTLLANDPPSLIAGAKPSQCAIRCADNGAHQYFANVASINCYCGNLPASPVQVAENMCSIICPGDPSVACGGGTQGSTYRIDKIPVPNPTWISDVIDKQLWKVKSSSVLDYESAALKAIDGVSAVDNCFKTSTEQAYPWIQIELDNQVTVFGLKITTEIGKSWRSSYNEIRVGDTDVAASTSPERRICGNKVCHMTGAARIETNEFECSVPLSGKYVSIQKYRRWEETSDGSWQWYLALSEVDILYLA